MQAWRIGIAVVSLLACGAGAVSAAEVRAELRQATPTGPGEVLGTVTISASAGGLAAGAGNPITFTVVAGAANKLALSGSTADLTAGTTRVLTATIQDVNGNTLTTGADSSLSVTFAKSAGTGTVTGLGSATASAGVATLTITGNAPGSITITASATGSGGALLFFRPLISDMRRRQHAERRTAQTRKAQLCPLDRQVEDRHHHQR